MYFRSRVFFLLFILTIIHISSSVAQQSRDSFGKNRVQFKEFDWRFFSTENFDIYFYDGGQVNARQAADFLEDEFDRITDLLGYAPYAKTKIFLYNSVTDLQQSNVGLNENNFTIGGQTNFVKLQVELAYPGTVTGFKEELLFKVSQILIRDMMFGGSLTDVLQSTYLMSLPKWFIDGAALYLANGWSIEMDDHMRDLMARKKIRKMNKLTGADAELAGQSVWNFIAERYGKSNISNILNLTRIIRNEENSISNTLGIPFKLFLSDWQSYYREMAVPVQNSYVLPDESVRIDRNHRKNFIYNNVRISPSGKYLAYSEGENGKYDVVVRDLENNKETVVFRGGQKVINQEINTEIPVLGWKDENTLGIVHVRSGKNILTLVDISTKRKQRIELERFNQVKTFDFSKNGNVMAVSADVEGQNDIYLFSLTRFNTKRITNDIYDDLNPKFLPDQNAFVFSSNRIHDSLNVEASSISEVGNNFNLFLYDLDTTTTHLSRVTKTISKDVYPIPVGDNNIYYLSDQKGIVNIFKYNYADSLYTQTSNYALSIKDYDINYSTGGLAYTMLHRGRTYVHYVPNFDFEKNVFTPGTRRQETIQAKYVSQRLAENREKKEKISDNQTDAPSLKLPERIAEPSGPEDLIELELPEEITDDIIDTDNYVFDTESIEIEEQSPSFLSNYRRLRQKSRIQGPLPYETRFSTDNVITSWVIDPLRGFGIQLEIEMNDLLENHKFYGGIMSITDLRHGDVFAEYQYLKKRIDLHARYDRKSIFWQKIDPFPKKYIMDRFEIGASLPINVSSRFTISPFFVSTKFLDLDFNHLLRLPPPGSAPTELSVGYGGLRFEYVFDNTIVRGLNLFEGTRAKARFEHYEGINNPTRSFSNLRVDIRNYKKIHRELIFATRLFYGGFYGKNKQNYLLGGMDNWLLYKTENDPTTGRDPLVINETGENSNLLFTEFVTNMRGFNYNKFHGNNAILFNAELRFPVIKYFTSGPIASNFFRNLQLVGFYDIGSAWTGSSPFSEDNSLNTEHIKAGKSFEAKIRNFRNPWLSGYGAGLRTVLLGYYVKFDVAWPVEDYITSEPKFYLTLGYDF